VRESKIHGEKGKKKESNLTGGRENFSEEEWGAKVEGKLSMLVAGGGGDKRKKSGGKKKSDRKDAVQERTLGEAFEKHS